MKIRLIALDLDGTTLNREKEIGRRTRRALERASEKGVNIVVATGRPFSALPEDIFSVEAIRYVLTSNGAAITDLREGKTFYKNCIAPEAVEHAIDMLRKYDYVIEGFIDGEAFIEKDYYEYVKRTGCSFREPKYILRTRKPVDGLYDFLLAHRDSVENINVNFDEISVADKPMMREKLMTLPEVTITSSFKNNLEIGGATTSKARALEEMSGLLGINSDEMMAVGDSPNDIAMLRASGLPVAMGNAEDEVKAVAKYITADNEHDGVGEAIEKFVLQ